MLNKDEIIYNSKSLVETWLNSTNNIKRIWVEMCGDNCNDIYPCTIDNCGVVMGELLYKHDEKYNLLNLYAEVGNYKKIIGSIDII